MKVGLLRNGNREPVSHTNFGSFSGAKKSFIASHDKTPKYESMDIGSEDSEQTMNKYNNKNSKIRKCAIILSFIFVIISIIVIIVSIHMYSNNIFRNIETKHEISLSNLLIILSFFISLLLSSLLSLLNNICNNNNKNNGINNISSINIFLILFGLFIIILSIFGLNNNYNNNITRINGSNIEYSLLLSYIMLSIGILCYIILFIRYLISYTKSINYQYIKPDNMDEDIPKYILKYGKLHPYDRGLIHKIFHTFTHYWIWDILIRGNKQTFQNYDFYNSPKYDDVVNVFNRWKKVRNQYLKTSKTFSPFWVLYNIEKREFWFRFVLQSLSMLVSLTVPTIIGALAEFYEDESKGMIYVIYYVHVQRF